MPKISDTLTKKEKNFKPKEYRAWGESDSDDTNNHQNKDNMVIEMDTANIINWQFHDRPETELGDIEALANDLVKIGQQQPCIVRPAKDQAGKYELIVGERRWHAARKAKIKLKVIIGKLSDHDAALAQATENENRRNLSDFARGMSYARLIESGVLKQKDLIDQLNISKQQVSRLLSFSKIPDVVINEIEDFSNVSARTAEQIKQIALLDAQHQQALVQLADKIRSGKVGHAKLKELVKKIIEPEQDVLLDKVKKVTNQQGKHIFSWRYDGNHLPSIHFTKESIQLLNEKNLEIDCFNEKLLKVFENELEI